MLNKSFVYIRNIYRQKLRSMTSLKTRRFKGAAGFSLFEFILVLIIVSVLVSIAIPKLLELKVDGHKGSVQVSANSLRSAVNIIHTLWQSQGSKDHLVMVKDHQVSTVTELTVLVGSRGWPIDIISHDTDSNMYVPVSDLISMSASTCERLWNGLLKNSASGVELEIDDGGNKKIISTFQSEFYQGVCRFKYLLGEDDFRVEYDPITGRVDTFF